MLDTAVIQIDAELRHRFSIAPESVEKTLTPSPFEVRVNTPRDWQLRPKGQDSNRSPHSFPPRVRAWLTVLHDLSFLSAKSNVLGYRLTPKPFTLGWAQTCWLGIGTEEAIICWPTPPWPSFWHFDKLAFHWNKAVEHLKDQSIGKGEEHQRIEKVALLWIDSIARVFQSQGVLEEPDKVLFLDSESNDLPARIGALRNGTDTHQQRLIDDWLLNLAALLAPEGGISASVTQMFCEEPELKNFWKTHQLRINKIRRGHLAEMERVGLSELAQSFEAQIPLWAVGSPAT